MKTFFIITGLIFITNIVSSQTIDTLYYDEEGHGIEVKEFASTIWYVLHAEEGSNYKNRFKAYYDTGQLYAEGEFISIDKYDLNNSNFGPCKRYYKNGQLGMDYNVRENNGNVISYYENGQIQETYSLKDGEINGDAYIYFEDGLIKSKATYLNGKMEGIVYVFEEGGESCFQYEYSNGEYAKPYFTHVQANGGIAKYYIKDNSPYLEIPKPEDRQRFHSNGITWDYYIKNGLVLMARAEINRSYGKYYTIYIVLGNNSVNPVIFNPDFVTAYKEYKGTTESLKVLGSNEYMNKVSNRQMWASALNAFNEGMAAAQAGYSSSSTQTLSTYGGQSGTVAAGAAIGTHGAAVGVGASVTNNAGFNATTTTTQNYNGAAAYQAQLIASNRVAEYNNALQADWQLKEEGYLKITTVDAGTSICGYLNIPYSKGERLKVNIVIDSMVYPFEWTINQ